MAHASNPTLGQAQAGIREAAGRTRQAGLWPTGIVSDSTCGATHKMKNMTPADCTRACAKQGGYALVVGTNVYALHGHEAELGRLAAEMVTVKGTVRGKTVTVESVLPGKKV